MDNFIWWPQIAAVLFFAGIWIGVTYLLSYISGWAFLAEHYRETVPYTGRYQRLPMSQLGRFGIFGGARNAVNVGVDPSGLHLRMFVLFRVNCRDLYIPWRDITVKRGHAYFRDYFEFRFAKAPLYGLRIFGGAGDVVRTLAGPAWPGEPAPDVIRR